MATRVIWCRILISITFFTARPTWAHTRRAISSDRRGAPGTRVQHRGVVTHHMLARLQVFPQGVEGGVEVTIADGKAAFRIVVQELEPAVHGGVFQMQRKAHPAVELAPFHMARGRDQVLFRELLGQPGADEIGRAHV